MQNYREIPVLEDILYYSELPADPSRRTKSERLMADRPKPYPQTLNPKP